MADYNIFMIPYPPSEAQITCYTTIRLEGLQTDPHAFGSTFERESKFTRDVWRERLNGSNRAVFVAHAERQPDEPKEDQNWVGTASVLNPEMLSASGYIQHKHLVSEDEVAYILVGMWIHPNHRRRGLGRRLVAAAKEYIQPNGRQDKRKVLMLQVHDHNLQARGLYESMGFVTGGPAEDSGEIWMLLRVSDGV